MTFQLRVGQDIWYISDDVPGHRSVVSGKIINFDAETLCAYRDDVGVEFKSIANIFLKEELAKRALSLAR
jgi:hypothetical protein